MPNESEAKLKVKDFSRVRRALRAAGAEFLGSAVESDTYFDTPGQSLRRADCGLRIRRLQVLRRGAGAAPADSRAVVTFKGPRQVGRRIKVRREVQTRLDDPAALVEIFTRCGLQVAMKIRKQRSSYRLGRCRVELDELPLIGRFVEIEGPSEKAVLAAQRRLGLAGPSILKPYIALLADCRRKKGISKRRTTFRG